MATLFLTTGRARLGDPRRGSTFWRWQWLCLDVSQDEAWEGRAGRGPHGFVPSSLRVQTAPPQPSTLLGRDCAEGPFRAGVLGRRARLPFPSFLRSCGAAWRPLGSAGTRGFGFLHACSADVCRVPPRGGCCAGCWGCSSGRGPGAFSQRASLSLGLGCAQGALGPRLWNSRRVLADLRQVKNCVRTVGPVARQRGRTPGRVLWVGRARVREDRVAAWTSLRRVHAPSELPVWSGRRAVTEEIAA